MRTEKIQRELDQARALIALRPMIIPNRDRCLELEHIKEEDKLNAKALLVMMKGNNEVCPTIVECLEDIADGCEHVSSRPREYIRVVARCYGYSALEVRND